MSLSKILIAFPLLIWLFACNSIAQQTSEPSATAAAMAKALPQRSPSVASLAHETPEYWRDVGRQSLNRAMQVASLSEARNVILFIGDGMSVATVTAARILQGQQRGESGEENALSFERFPYTALSKTYTVDAQTSESAGTMTAIMTGVKTRSGSISIDQRAERGSCAGNADRVMTTLLEEAERAGMATGVVTTTSLTHATPAATYAHVSDRNWESDAEMPAKALEEGCRDIARQFVEFPVGNGIEVAFGGGRQFFMTDAQADPEEPFIKGKRRDGRDLIAQWRERHPRGQYVWNRDQFQQLKVDLGAPILGLFDPSHMDFEADRGRDVGGEPSLAEMTEKALVLLRQSEKGFFLMVEAGRIDHAHHAGNAFRALTEATMLADAVERARALTDEKDTLIIVTADHSHTMTIAGYPRRGNPILGLVEETPNEPAKDASGLPYTTLGYANGPGYLGASDVQAEGSKLFPHFARSFQGNKGGRPNLSPEQVTHPLYLQEATVPGSAETHAGDDVAIYANGPGAQWVRGVIEQNVIYWIMREALKENLRHAAVEH